MSRQYSLKAFLRKASSDLLKRYLAGKRIGGDVDWDAVTERKIERVFDAIAGAPERVQAAADRDFREINDMDSEGTRLAITGEGPLNTWPYR